MRSAATAPISTRSRRSGGAPGSSWIDAAMTVFGYRLPMMSSLLLWCLIWEIVGRSDLILLFPPFSSVLASLVELVQTQKFWTATWITISTFCIGMALAIACGVALGVLMGRVRSAENLLGMWVNVFASAPLSALVPVLMILFGMGNTTIVVSVFLFAVWIIALDTQAGVKHITPSLIDMAKSFGAGRRQIYAKVILWAALPEILA